MLLIVLLRFGFEKCYPPPTSAQAKGSVVSREREFYGPSQTIDINNICSYK